MAFQVCLCVDLRNKNLPRKPCRIQVSLCVRHLPRKACDASSFFCESTLHLQPSQKTMWRFKFVSVSTCTPLPFSKNRVAFQDFLSTCAPLTLPESHVSFHIVSLFFGRAAYPSTTCAVSSFCFALQSHSLPEPKIELEKKTYEAPHETKHVGPKLLPCTS